MPFTCAREIYENPRFAQFCILLETYKLYFAEAIQSQPQPRGDSRYDPDNCNYSSPFTREELDKLVVPEFTHFNSP